MITGTMPHIHIAHLFFNDWQAINSTNTISRLAGEYDKERNKLKVDTSIAYPKCYEVKTNAKNKWLLFFSKSHSVTKYRNIGSINYIGAVYYDTSDGIEVIKEAVGFGANIYKPEFFQNYKSQMDLSISSPFDLIKNFFINNGYSIGDKINDDDFIMSVNRDGFMLGYLENESILINQHFFNREKVHNRQSEFEKTIINGLQVNIEALLNSNDWVKKDYDLHTDIMKGIKKRSV